MDAVTAEDAIGSVIGDTYELVRIIGRGGMGTVWEASHLRLPGKRVAIKFLQAKVAERQDAFQRFRREAEIASRIGHPNIVEVHDFNVLPSGQPYLVLELLDGIALDERMRQERVGIDQIRDLVFQVGSALSAAHNIGVVHRDLKPQNIFLCDSNDDELPLAKVLDFGISKIRGSDTLKTSTDTLLGTPQYMAPEQARGLHDQVDARTDIFSFGCVVYELLTGVSPFNGNTIPEVVFRVVYEPPPPIEAGAFAAHEVAAVEKALAKEQDERFASVDEFVEAFCGEKRTSSSGSRRVARASGAAPSPSKVISGSHRASPSMAAAMAMEETLLPSEIGAQLGNAQTMKPDSVAGPRVDLGVQSLVGATEGMDPPTAPRVGREPSRGRRSWLLPSALVCAVTFAGIFALLAVRKGDTQEDDLRLQASVTPPADLAEDPAGQVAAAPKAPEPGSAEEESSESTAAPALAVTTTKSADDLPKEAAAKTTTEAQKTPQTGAGKGRAPQAKPNAIPKEAQDFNERATKALADGNAAEARRLAKQSLSIYADPNPEAFVILTKASCLERSLGTANGFFRRVRKRQRQQVLEYCRTQGMSLSE